MQGLGLLSVDSPLRKRFLVMRSIAFQEETLHEHWVTAANPLSLCGQESSPP